MNAKAKGSRAERRVITALEAAGYCCTRAAGSLGVWDVIAIGAHDIRLVQVKAGDRCQVSPAEKEQMQLFVAPPNASREIWRYFDRAKAPSIERLVGRIQTHYNDEEGILRERPRSA